MNKNIDLTKILEGCPSGTKFYSRDFEEVAFVELSIDNEYDYFSPGAVGISVKALSIKVRLIKNLKKE